ncbi:MAG: hypothetical protein ACJATX_000174 [Candidatus Paceibacteria bacterium]|jgi:hypothetical protein
MLTTGMSISVISIIVDLVRLWQEKDESFIIP